MRSVLDVENHTLSLTAALFDTLSVCKLSYFEMGQMQLIPDQPTAGIFTGSEWGDLTPPVL